MTMGQQELVLLPVVVPQHSTFYHGKRFVSMMRMMIVIIMMMIPWTGVTIAISSSSIRPDITIGIKQDSSNKDDTSSLSLVLEPSVRYVVQGGEDEMIQYKGGVTVRGASDGTIPYTIWGRVSKDLFRKTWNILTKVESTSERFQSIQYDISATGGPTNVQMKCLGNIDLDPKDPNQKMIKVNKIQAKQSIKLWNQKKNILTVVPSYTVASKSTDLSVSYRVQDTTVSMDAYNVMHKGSNNGYLKNVKNKYTIQQQIQENNKISSSITNQGEIDFEYQRNLDDIMWNGGIGSIYYKPNSNIKFQYKDEDGWEASMITPILSSRSSDPNKKKKNFSLGTLDTNHIQFSIRRSII
jgi:hypothetical protein